MCVMTIALLQMIACGDDQEANLAKGEEFCRRARDMGADVAVFPEMWNIGYTFQGHPEEGAPISVPNSQGQETCGGRRSCGKVIVVPTTPCPRTRSSAGKRRPSAGIVPSSPISDSLPAS